jgi:hypothetical protein
MKNALAVIGGFVVVLYVMGALGIGNFVLRYDVNPILCIRGV